MLKMRAAALALLLLLGACSAPDESAPQSQPPPSGAGPTVDAREDDGGHDHGSHGGFGSGGSKSKGSGDRPGDGGDGASGGASGEGEGGSGNAPSDGSGSDSGSDGGGGGSAAPADYPASGAYVYSQKGSEAFCDPSGSCDRHDLPRRQRIDTSYGQRTQTEAIVITEVQSSNGRYVRTTQHFTPDAAFVTEVYYRLVYEGLTLQEQYNPDPPVPQLRFPLRAGREWSAEWKAETSGDYHARVTGVESVDVGGTAVDAFRIETTTNFRGELRGKGSVVWWVDARTRAVVRTQGALKLSAGYGSYNTNFETTLASAPGY